MTARAAATSFKGARSRAALLAAARSLFAERGFHGASVGDVADAAGLRKPSLFHHFATKEQLHREVMNDIFAELSRAIAGPVAAPGTYAQRLDVVNDALVGYFAANPDAARLLFREALDPTAPSCDGVERALGVLAHAERFLADGMDAGEFAAQAPKQLLLSLTGLHLAYFTLGPLVTPMLGGPLDSAAMVAARRAAVRAQVRAMVLAPARTAS